MTDKATPIVGLPGVHTATVVGFDCPVLRPIARSGQNAGVGIGVSETNAGPALLIQVAHPDGLSQTAVIGADKLAGFMALMNRQATRIADMLAPTPDQATKQ